MGTYGRTSPRRLLASALVAGALLAAGASPSAAQQPVVFVHGINSDGSTWQSDVDYFRNVLGANAQNPTLGQAYPLPVQAQRLTSSLASYGFVGNNTLLIGHSQGGLISRYSSRLTGTGLRGLITVATPHGGAPIAVNAGYFQGVLSEASYDIGGFVVLETEFGDYLPTSGDYPIYIGEDIAYALTVGYLINLGAQSISSNYFSGQASLGDLAPGSAFLQVLNNDYLFEEVNSVDSRIGLNVQLDGGYLGGPLRLQFGAFTSDNLGTYIIAYGNQLLFDAVDDLGAIDPEDPNFLDMLVGLYAEYDLGSIAYSWPNIWCNTIGTGWGCGPSDGIVPLGSQAYPASTNLPIVGPSHTEETTDLNVRGTLGQLVTSIAQGG